MKTLLFLQTLCIFSLTDLALASPTECFIKAHYRSGRINLDEASAVKLCAGAHNNTPIDCYLDAIYRSPNDVGLRLNSNDAVSLCASARDLMPLNCFREAHLRSGNRPSLSLNKNVAIILCTQG